MLHLDVVVAMTFQIHRALESLEDEDSSSLMYVTALRAAAAAFNREERMRQLHSGSFRLTKHNGEQVDLTRITRTDKVLAPQALIHAMFKIRFT